MGDNPLVRYGRGGGPGGGGGEGIDPALSEILRLLRSGAPFPVTCDSIYDVQGILTTRPQGYYTRDVAGAEWESVRLDPSTRGLKVVEGLHVYDGSDWQRARVTTATRALKIQIRNADHGLIHASASLLDDDHTQYLLLAGRAGGQVAYGGTAASEMLTIHGTSHATKGPVRVGTGAWLDVPEVAAPGTPTSGFGSLYAKTDGKLYWKDDAGTETDLTLGSAHNVLSATHGDALTESVVLGDLIHGNATPKWGRLAGNTTATKKYLTQTGTGAVSAAPAWDTIIDGDLPSTIVRTSRTINTTAPVTGGGDLSADRTIAVSDMVGDAGVGGTRGTVPAPGAGDAAAGKYLKADGVWTVPPAGASYTDEQAQDAIGSILLDTTRINLVYDDATPNISADLIANTITAGYLSATTTDVLFGRSSALGGAGEEIACTAFARTILDDADAATVRATIGAGTGSGTVTSVTGTAPVASSGGATPAISLGVSAGSKFLASTALDTWAEKDITAAGLALLDDATAGDQLTTLGVSVFAKTILDDADAAAVRSTIGAGTGDGTVTSVGATSPITSSGGATPTISTSMATNKLIGRGTAGAGVMEEITLGTNLSLAGTTLNASGGGSEAAANRVLRAAAFI